MHYYKIYEIWASRMNGGFGLLATSRVFDTPELHEVAGVNTIS
jgi:hypothetical protein